jgi:hypothetical protein
MCILTVGFRMIPSLLRVSSKPWRYGMYSVCRDPKTQKWRRWLTLRGCPFGVKNIRIRVLHAEQGRYGHQEHVETVSVWIMCLKVEILSSHKVLGPNEYPLSILQTSGIRNEPDRLPAEESLGSSENFIICAGLFILIPLVWYSETCKLTWLSLSLVNFDLLCNSACAIHLKVYLYDYLMLWNSSLSKTSSEVFLWGFSEIRKSLAVGCGLMKSRTIWQPHFEWHHSKFPSRKCDPTSFVVDWEVEGNQLNQ